MIQAGDERPHPPGADPRWTESWYVDFADDDGVGGFVRLALVPGSGRAWLWAALVTPEDLVLVRDHDLPPPRAGGLEARGSGVWVDLECETPMTHWTVGLEAFGVGFDDPLDAYRGERGDRVPLGFDLEWEAAMPPFEHPAAAVRHDAGHYQHAGRVHGEVLVGSRRLEIDAFGERDRAWGVRDFWSAGWHWSAFRLHDGETFMSLARPDRPGGEHATGYVAVEGEDAHPLVWGEVDATFGAEGLPTGARYRLEDDGLVDVEVLATVPVLIPRPEGGASRLPRALCRFRGASGEGTGWAEWLQVSREG